MKFILDTEACKKNGRDADLILYLVSFLTGSKITANTFEKARQQNFLKFNAPYNRANLFPDYVELNEQGEFLAESILADSEMPSNSEDRFVNLANKLRELFPSGKKPGYAYTWRDSTSCIVDRLKKFVMKYGNHPDDEIIAATKKYVDSFNGNYQYMQLLKYFIWKNKVTGGELIDGRMVGEVEKQSQLAAYLEDTDDSTPTHAEWDVELR